MAKKLKWFRIDEDIPESAVYIRSEKRKVGTQIVKVEDWPPYGGCTSYSNEEVDVLEQQHLYEVYDEPKPLGVSGPPEFKACAPYMGA